MKLLKAHFIKSSRWIIFPFRFESSSSVATFALYELALNQDIQDRLRKEINETLSKYGDKFTYDGMMEMKYLDMVLNETLRMYPVNDTQFRKCARNFKIANTKLVIPRDTLIVVSSHALHRDERFFDHPNKFDPERFTDENVKKIRPFTYIPFSKFILRSVRKIINFHLCSGEGPRMCIGSRFGMMQTKSAIVKLLTNYRLSPSKKTTIPMKFVPTSSLQSPFGGMFLNVEKV